MVGLRSLRSDRVVGIDDEEADDVLAALSTESAREILVALRDDPATVPELAERTDLTAQNVSYHLGKLGGTGLVRTEGTRGSGGNEAAVYAPAEPVVVSTATGVGHRIVSGLVGLLVGGLLALVCLL